jgi:hypothetical protein
MHTNIAKEGRCACVMTHFTFWPVIITVGVCAVDKTEENILSLDYSLDFDFDKMELLVLL